MSESVKPTVKDEITIEVGELCTPLFNKVQKGVNPKVFDYIRIGLFDSVNQPITTIVMIILDERLTWMT